VTGVLPPCPYRSLQFPMAERILVWNVRGSNARSHQNKECELVVVEHASRKLNLSVFLTLM
jgi:hypothetical protein